MIIKTEYRYVYADGFQTEEYDNLLALEHEWTWDDVLTIQKREVVISDWEDVE